jgi:hypothetical protein
MKQLVVLACLVLLVPACAASRAQTATGKAEVYIARVHATAYRDALVAGMADRGYTILDVTEYKASFEKEGNVGSDLLIGSGSRRRVTFDFVPYGPDQLRVMGRLDAVDRSGDIHSTQSGQDIYEFMQFTAAAVEQSSEKSAP